MIPRCEVDFTCNGDVQCKDCDWRGAYGTSCFAWTDAEKIAALLDELKELTGKWNLIRLSSGKVGLWIGEPQRCCNGNECGCQGMPVDPPDMIFDMH